MSFTYKDNGTVPVAKIRKIDGSGKPRLVYIDSKRGDDSESQPSILNEPLEPEIIKQVVYALEHGMTLNKVITFLSALDAGDESEDDGNKNLVGSSIVIEDNEELICIPSIKNERLIIGGPTGCGKSTFIKDYASQWQRMFPEKQIHIFCRQSDDPAFKDIKHNEIVVDDSILGEEIGIEDFVDCLVIFDDMDNLQDKDQAAYIHKLMADLMANGRKQNITTVYVTHIFMNKDKTRLALNESNKLVFFNGLGDRGNTRVLKEYGGMNTKDVERLTSLKSRWCCLERSRPRYLTHEKGIFLI